MKVMTKTTMKAAAINRFGDIRTLSIQTCPIPRLSPNEILIRVESAGVGTWDPYERHGGFKGMMESKPKFPYILGSDGAGTVAAAGSRVRRFKKGDRVYSLSFLNPKGGFYAEYAVVKADDAAVIPEKLTTEEAGAMPVCAITALQGLDDTLGLKSGESVMIFGASGGVGHLAVQLAKIMGARVFAVASGSDGVKLARKLGADTVVDGHKDGVAAAARKFAPDGFDAALFAAGGRTAEKALESLRKDGRIAYPNGVEPEPKAHKGQSIESYDGVSEPQAYKKLNRLIESGPFVVHITRAFPLEKAADAHRALDSHFPGKLILQP
jgi:NADPH2:quinone reductase